MEGVEDIPGTALHEGHPVGLGVVPRVPRRARAHAARHRRRRRTCRTPRCACTSWGSASTATTRPPTTSTAMRGDPARVDRGRCASASRPGAPTAIAACTVSPSRAPSPPIEELDALVEAMDDARARRVPGRAHRDRRDQGGDPEGAMETELQWMIDLAAKTRNAGDVPRDGEQRRPRRVAAVVRGGAPGERGGREPPSAGRRPVLRRAPRSPVADEPLQVRADLRAAGRAAAARRGSNGCAATRCGLRSSPSAREQPGVDDARPHPRRAVRATSSRSATSWSTSRRPSRAWRRSRHATGSIRGGSCTTCCSAPTVASSCSARCSTSAGDRTTVSTT